MPLRAAMPRTVRKPTSEPSEMMPSPSVGREHPAHQGRRQGQEGQGRQAPAAESRLQEQEDPDHGGQPGEQQALLGGCRSAASPSSWA